MEHFEALLPDRAHMQNVRAWSRRRNSPLRPMPGAMAGHRKGNRETNKLGLCNGDARAGEAHRDQRHRHSPHGCLLRCRHIDIRRLKTETTVEQRRNCQGSTSPCSPHCTKRQAPPRSYKYHVSGLCSLCLCFPFLFVVCVCVVAFVCFFGFLRTLSSLRLLRFVCWFVVCFLCFCFPFFFFFVLLRLFAFFFVFCDNCRHFAYFDLCVPAYVLRVF